MPPIDETESIHSLDRIASMEAQAAAAKEAATAAAAKEAAAAAAAGPGGAPLAAIPMAAIPMAAAAPKPVSVDDDGSRRSSMSSTVSLTDLNAEDDKELADDFASLQANPPQMPQPDYAAQRRRRSQREQAWQKQQKSFAEQETPL